MPRKHLNAVRDEHFGKFLPRRIVIVARLVIRYDSNDFKISITRSISIRLIKSRELDLASERIFVRKILVSESRVYDHNVPGSANVAFREQSAAEQRYSESLEIVLADRFVPNLPSVHVRLAGNHHVRPVEFQRRFFVAFGRNEYTGN